MAMTMAGAIGIRDVIRINWGDAWAKRNHPNVESILWVKKIPRENSSLNDVPRYLPIIIEICDIYIYKLRFAY